MDIRVAAYGPSVVSTFTNSAGTKATTYVQNAAQSAPVQAAPAVNASRSGGQIADANGGGYTDSVRGSIINILA